MAGSANKRKAVSEEDTERKSIHEIDEIFLNSKKNKELKRDEAASAASSGKAKARKKRNRKNEQAFSEDAGLKKEGTKIQPESRRKMQEGFNIYTEEELGWNKKNAGGTALCPFDCDCCF